MRTALEQHDYFECKTCGHQAFSRIGCQIHYEKTAHHEFEDPYGEDYEVTVDPTLHRGAVDEC